MARSQGDLQKSRAMTMGEIVADLARGIEVRDERYDNFWKYKPIPKMMNPDPNEGFFASKKPIKAACGANRSTKTWSSVFECIMIYTGIIPPSMQGLYAHEETLREITSGPSKRPRHVRIIVQSLGHFADTIEPILTGQGGLLPEAWSTWDSTVHMYRGPDGSYLEIMPIDPREKVAIKTANTLRGGDIDHTMIDEITAYAAYTESIARAAAKKDGPKTVTIAYCPQEGFECWTYEALFLSSYERKGHLFLRKNPEGCYPDVFCVKVSMKDNPSITPEAYESQKRRYKPWEVCFRVDGEYSDRTSNPFFSVEELLAWEEQERYSIGRPFILREAKVDVELGIFDGELLPTTERDVSPGCDYDEKRFPIWRIWEIPTHGEKYVISADLSEGNPGSDPHSVTVWNCTNQERSYEAAKLHMRLIKPGALAVQACCMATVYGECLLVPEANNTGGGMFMDRSRNYVNLYSRLKSGDSEAERETDKLGWFTNRYNKGAMLDNAYRMLSHMANMKIPSIDKNGELVVRNFCPFNSRAVIREFIGYEEKIERDKNNIPSIVWGAASGSHDDTVMEACIAFRIINHEYEKISACKLKQNTVQAFKNRHRTELQKLTRPKAFSNMRKQEGLKNMRNRMGPNHG